MLCRAYSHWVPEVWYIIIFTITFILITLWLYFRVWFSTLAQATVCLILRHSQNRLNRSITITMGSCALYRTMYTPTLFVRRSWNIRCIVCYGGCVFGRVTWFKGSLSTPRECGDRGPLRPCCAHVFFSTMIRIAAVASTYMLDFCVLSTFMALLLSPRRMLHLLWSSILVLVLALVFFGFSNSGHCESIFEQTPAPSQGNRLELLVNSF